MGLLETGLLGQTEAGQIAFLDPLPKSFAEIFLQDSEFHGRSIARLIAMRYFKSDFHSCLGITTLRKLGAIGYLKFITQLVLKGASGP